MADTEGAVAAVHRAENIRVWLSWLYVGIPLGWGVVQTVLKSIALFR